jgi:SAM-dependent methyltransferase
VDLVEVIEHIENQPQLIREIQRVLKPGGVVVITTPNILNVMSRLRFLFTGFMRGRVRPVHYSSKPGVAPNIYLIHFYELYYLLFHYDFQIVQLRKTRVKFASRLFSCVCWPFMWLFSLVAVVHAEKDPIQRKYNWQILSYFFHPAVLLSDNLVVKAQKRPTA